MSFIFPFCFVLVFSLEMMRAHLETHLSGTKAAQAAYPDSSAPGFSMHALQYRYTAFSLKKFGRIAVTTECRITTESRITLYMAMLLKWS